MKNNLLFFLIFLGSALNVHSQKGLNLPERPPTVVIYYTFGGETTNKPDATGIQDWGSSELVRDLLQYLEKEIHEQLPCVKLITKDDIAIMFVQDREKALLGSEDETIFADISKLLDCDFLINLHVTKFGDNLLFSSSTYQQRRSKVIDKDVETSSINNYQDDRMKFVKDIIKTMIEMQLCPFRGNFFYEFTLTSSIIKESGGQSQSHESLYHHSKHKKDTEISEKWNFEKRTRIGAMGTINYTYEETDEYKAEGRSRCLKCKDGVLVDEFYPPSNWSESEVKRKFGNCNKLPKGNPYNAIIELEFDERDETFMINVKAVSDSSTYHDSKISEANSKCPCPPKRDPDFPDRQSKFVKTLNKSFGPFKGKITDKTLQCLPKTEVYDSEDGTGRTTYSHGFNFKR